MNDTFLEAKIVLLGDTGVGKTSIVVRYVEQRFSSVMSPTIGASFLTKTIIIDGVRVKLQLWDTAGQERFRSLAPMYYRGAAAAVLIYDVASEESFHRVKEWVKELRTNVFDEILLVIVGNQIDKPYREVSNSDAQEYAHSIGALCVEASAKKNIGIDELFGQIAKQLVDAKIPSLTEKQHTSQVFRADANKPKKREKCCSGNSA